MVSKTSEEKVEEKEKEKPKQLSPEELKKRVHGKVRSTIFHLSKLDKEHQEELTFLLSLFDSVYSESNPNFFQLFKGKLIMETSGQRFD